MGFQDTIREMEKELLALRKQADSLLDTTELDLLKEENDKLKDLVASLSKENKSLKTKNTKLSNKLLDLESSLKVVDAAVDKALDDE